MRAATGRRQGWEERYARLAANGEGSLLDGDTLVPSKWEQEEWEW